MRARFSIPVSSPASDASMTRPCTAPTNSTGASVASRSRGSSPAAFACPKSSVRRSRYDVIIARTSERNGESPGYCISWNRIVVHPGSRR